MCVCTKSCPTLCDPMDCSLPGRLLCPWDSPGKNTGVGCHFLLQGIFPTQGSNPCLLLWQVDFFTTKPPAGCQTDHLAAVACPLAPSKRSLTAQFSVWHTVDKSIISCYDADSCPDLQSHAQVYVLYIFIKWSKHQYGLKSKYRLPSNKEILAFMSKL